MPYKRKTYKKPITKKIYKKKSIKKTSNKKSNLVKLIKQVALKQSETKHTHFLVENQQLYHNSCYVKNNLLNTTQGISDNQTGTSAFSSRIGDEVIARGLSFKIWAANKSDRPNVMYRLIVYKYQSLSSPSSTAIFTGANGNKMMDDIDREYVTVVYQKIFNVQLGFSAVADPNQAGDQDGVEAHRYFSFYIPLKNKKIYYADNSNLPKFIDYGFQIVPYDSYGTLESDNISSMAFQYKFYFKDP